MKNKASDW